MKPCIRLVRVWSRDIDREFSPILLGLAPHRPGPPDT
jgi:hypothetical protein